MGFFARKKRGYRAAIRVEKFRADAEFIRRSNPALFDQILSQASGTEAEADARADPDAYVALFLAEAKDAGLVFDDGVIPKSSAPVASDDPQRDRIFNGLIEQLGGLDQAIDVVQMQAESNGAALTRESALDLIEEWRTEGLVRNVSLGEYLDGARVTRRGR